MADNLPLIPKKGAVCADVRPVLREVFREQDYLPPLAMEKSTTLVTVAEKEDTQPIQGEWIDKYSVDCKDIWTHEYKLKQDHARRISRKPLPNIYKISSPLSESDVSSWRKEHGIISRKDLIPSIEQNAGRDASLWVQNILNRSSCDVSCVEIQGSQLRLPLYIPPPDKGTIQSLSIGEVVIRPPPPPAPVPQPPPAPEYIICVPPQLDFVNFTVGHMHSQSIRLVNVSKFEIRLSLRPPSRRELDVVLCGPRGLAVSSGAAAELRVRFKPRDVRAMRDALLVRLSVGKDLTVPIYCYMQPPIVDLLVPYVNWSSLWCSSGLTVQRGVDVLELGARLLGDVHHAQLLLCCEAQHAAFFVLTEDAWITFCLDTLTRDGAVIAGPFTISPAWWRGGGSVHGSAWCRAPHVGLHVAALRVLSSTAVARPLNILADALHFTPNHLTLEAQDKDYDICSEDDPDCEYYVHLGTAFPNRSLSATVQLVNHSPVTYSYYWSVRPWGVCSCWKDELASDTSLSAEATASNRLCVGALETRDNQGKMDSLSGATATAHLTRMSPARGRVAPRSSCPLQVCMPDVGTKLGTQRAVLMLILKDIPKESFSPDYVPMIVKTESVLAEAIPGQEPWVREVCEVVCSQLEVWWEVVPVRFVLDPPILFLPHSRRVKEVELMVRATQLYGSESVVTRWCLPPRAPAPAAPALRLSPVQSADARLAVTLPSLPNEQPETDVFVLEAANGEWQSQSMVIRECATRHPRLVPARAWLGVVAPGTHMHKHLHVYNDTHQHICWWGTPFRWHGENEPSKQCSGREPCTACRERACTCALLRPARGALAHMRGKHMLYDVNAPDSDGCVATLIQVRRTLGDVARVPSGAGCEARASLVAYRVLAPRLIARALPCHGDKVPGECEGCTLDTGGGKGTGTAVLRPSEALTLGRCTCYRLRITNITPLPTTVRWEAPIEKEDNLKVTFIPNDFDVGSYGQIEIRVVIEARKVCGRRIFAYRARVDRAYKPLYLLIDTAVSGLQITCTIPIGGEEQTPASVIMRRTQKEEFPWEEQVRALSAEEMFKVEDKKREVQADNVCHCRNKMVFISEVKPPRPPPATEEDLPSIEILWEPPPLTRVCACDTRTKPVLPEFPEPYCLQFIGIPLRTVRSRTLIIRNESALAARWTTAVRNWPRKRCRTLTTDAWSVDVREPGVALDVAPARGVLGARAALALAVCVYADCWGLYRDQILIKIDKLEPIILDVWVEAVGAPLQLVRAPRGSVADLATTLWMSSSDPDRVIRMKNVSRAELVVHAYVLKEHEHLQDVMPFRLYLRFFDVLPRVCPCVTAFDSDHCLDEQFEDSGSKVPEDMDTGVEIFFTKDCGEQTDTLFKVDPPVFTIAPGAFIELQVTLSPSEHGELAPDAVILFRTQPSQIAGPGWYRDEPPPQLVRLRQAEREGVLRASDKQLRVKFCALDLPTGDVMRIRKSLRIQNIGNGPLHITASTKETWSIVQGGEDHSANAKCRVACGCSQQGGERVEKVPLYLPPRSSTEMILEVCIHTSEAWPAVDGYSPCTPPKYQEWERTATPLSFYDDDNVLLTIPLILELEYPLLRIEPSLLDFGFVTDGDSRKSFFTVAHSSRTVTLDLETEWVGNNDFMLWPQRLHLPPGACERVYVQYTARWRGGPVEGCARVVYTPGGAGAWCRASLPCRARPARDHKCHATVHDHTDDPHLLPPGLTFI